MAQKDYYQIMGLTRDASDKDIKMAYRRLARKYHPDLNKESNAEEKFKELGEAYEVLRDPAKRKAYDQYGADWEFAGQRGQSSTQSPGFDWQNYRGAQAGFDFDPEIFESIFGGRGFHHAPQAGQDVQGRIEISLEEAYHGAVKEIQLALNHHAKAETIRVKIPAGVKAGQQIRLAGKGQPGHAGAPKGDLLITIELAKHPLFDVIGNDIYLTLPVTPWEAALGATIAVPTLAGKVDLKIPPHSQGGQKLRLKQRGLAGATPGDQYVLLKIMIPQPTTDAQKALYQQLAQDLPFNPRAHMGV